MGSPEAVNARNDKGTVRGLYFVSVLALRRHPNSRILAVSMRYNPRRSEPQKESATAASHAGRNAGRARLNRSAKRDATN